MTKVLIVEDSDTVRMDLRTIIPWGKEGYEIVGEARNGSIGLEMYRNLMPDIVISDIEMPVMGGLEMLRKIKQISRESDVGFILLTAYTKFEYAKEAINLGIDSYIVKYEITPEYLLTELHRQTIKLQGNRTDQNAIDKMNLRRWLRRGRTDRIQEVLKREYIYHLVIACSLNRTYDKDDDTLFYRNVDEKLSVYPFDDKLQQGALNIDANEDTILFLVWYARKSSTAQNQENCRHTAQMISDLLETDGTQVLTVMSLPVTAENGQELYRNLQKMTEEKYFLNRSTVIYQSEEKKEGTEGRRREQVGESFVKIREAIRSGKPLPEELNIRNFLENSVLPTHDVDLFFHYQRNLLYLFFEQAESAENLAVIRKLEQISEQVEHLNVYQLGEALDQVYRELTIKIQYSPKIKKILKYVDEHYAEDISLNQVADVMEMSVVYVSQLFKKETGMNFTSYLTEVRINKAEELLKTGKYKIYEVSEMVGYQTMQYFSKVFRKVTGQYPKEYR